MDQREANKWPRLNITFADFKAKLRNFEETETEKIWAAESRDSVITTQGGVGGRRSKTNPLKRKDNTEPVCFRCDPEGHVAGECGKKARRGRCASETHKDNRDKRDRAYQVSREDDTDFAFRIRDGGTDIQEKGLAVDTGPTSHIIKDAAEFTGFDNTFPPEKHSVESADGTRCTEIAQKRGPAEAGARVDKHVNVLPTEMLVHVFGYLDVVGLCRASQTCWRWDDIIDDSEQLWRRQCLQVKAVCPSQVDSDRRDGLSWKLTVMRNYSCSHLKTAWLRGDFSNITSADQLTGRTMVPLDVDIWGDILQAELDR